MASRSFSRNPQQTTNNKLKHFSDRHSDSSVCSEGLCAEPPKMASLNSTRNSSLMRAHCCWEERSPEQEPQSRQESKSKKARASKEEQASKQSRSLSSSQPYQAWKGAWSGLPICQERGGLSVRLQAPPQLVWQPIVRAARRGEEVCGWRQLQQRHKEEGG